VADDAVRSRTKVDGRGGRLLVGQQLDDRDPARDLGHLSDQAVGRDDRVVQPDARVRAGSDHDLLLELARGPPDHADGDPAVVRREARAVSKAEQPSELLVLARGGPALDHFLAEVVDLPAKPLVLRLRARKPADPARGVAERPRHALGGHLEGTQAAREAALHPVQPATRGLPEVDADERERDDHEGDDDDPPAQHAPRACARRRDGGLRAPLGGAERRHPC